MRLVNEEKDSVSIQKQAQKFCRYSDASYGCWWCSQACHGRQDDWKWPDQSVRLEFNKKWTLLFLLIAMYSLLDVENIDNDFMGQWATYFFMAKITLDQQALDPSTEIFHGEPSIVVCWNPIVICFLAVNPPPLLFWNHHGIFYQRTFQLSCFFTNVHQVSSNFTNHFVVKSMFFVHFDPLKTLRSPNSGRSLDLAARFRRASGPVTKHEMADHRYPVKGIIWYGCFHFYGGTPSYHPFIGGDFPWNKPSSYPRF